MGRSWTCVKRMLEMSHQPVMWTGSLQKAQKALTQASHGVTDTMVLLKACRKQHIAQHLGTRTRPG